MIKNVLCSITDVAVYPIVALVLFLFVFTVAAVRAFTLKKSQAAALCRMPLEDCTMHEGDLP